MAIVYSRLNVPEGFVRVTTTVVKKFIRRKWIKKGNSANGKKRRVSKAEFKNVTTVKVVPIDAHYLRYEDVIQSSPGFEGPARPIKANQLPPRERIQNLETHNEESSASVSTIEFSSFHFYSKESYTAAKSSKKASWPVKEVDQAEEEPQDVPVRHDFLVTKEFLGFGSFGSVYRAENVITGRSFAMKSFCDFEEAETEIAVFKLIGDLPKFPNYHSSFHFNGKSILVMSYFSGENLNDILQKGRRKQLTLSETETKFIFHQILEGLASLHRKKLGYHDLKPANIIYDRVKGQVRIVDVGFIRPFSPKLEDNDCGTLAFTPPEMAYGIKNFSTPAKDVWSVGINVFVVLAGILPFKAYSVEGFKEELASIQLNFLESFRHYFSFEAYIFLQCALDVRPHLRYSCEQLMSHPWMRDAIPPAMDVGQGYSL